LEYFNVNIFASEMNQSYRWKKGNWYSVDTDEPLETDQEITVEILDVNISSENLNMTASLDRVLLSHHKSSKRKDRPISPAITHSSIDKNNDGVIISHHKIDNNGNDDDHAQHYNNKRKKKHKS
jgi:hypothetical protein